jgi:diguanylate cyclase
MRDNLQKPITQNPADVAREAFRRLATRRIAPTPDAYRDIYDEIVGTAANLNAETVLTRFAVSIADTPGEISDFGAQFNRSLAARDWHDYSKNLDLLIEKLVKQPPSTNTDMSQPVRERVNEIQASGVQEDARIRILRELLARTLTFAVASLLQDTPELAAEAEALAMTIKDAQTEDALGEVATRLKQLCFKIELRSGDMAEQHELLLRLFKLLLENVSELLEDDSWLSGQIVGVQHLLSGPISHSALEDATRSLKEVIYKQGILKHSLTETKVTVKNMMITFIDRLGAVAATTGDYHQKIDEYSQKISQAQDIGELNRILDDVMRETRITQTEALRSRDEMISARQEVQEAEVRIHVLESKLEQMSELVREDQLTGSLNRRGLDDVLERELARADRRQSPLCVAMLDVDDFKCLNDTYGHTIGDAALVHLVRVIKDTLRTMDVVARFGGEEFLIVLPDTSAENAMLTVMRLQKELAKRIFTQQEEHVQITFSAGVALRGSGEDQEMLIKRADDALYKAKKAGKNRVIAAD